MNDKTKSHNVGFEPSTHALHIVVCIFPFRTDMFFPLEEHIHCIFRKMEYLRNDLTICIVLAVRVQHFRNDCRPFLFNTYRHRFASPFWHACNVREDFKETAGKATCFFVTAKHFCEKPRLGSTHNRNIRTENVNIVTRALTLVFHLVSIEEFNPISFVRAFTVTVEVTYKLIKFVHKHQNTMRVLTKDAEELFNSRVDNKKFFMDGFVGILWQSLHHSFIFRHIHLAVVLLHKAVIFNIRLTIGILEWLLCFTQRRSLP